MSQSPDRSGACGAVCAPPKISCSSSTSSPYCLLCAAFLKPRRYVARRMAPSTSSQRTSPWNTCSGSGSTESTAQDNLIGVMKRELSGATWESSSILAKLLPHDTDTVDEVCSQLKKQGLSSAYFQGKTKQNPWPTDGQESSYYNPLVRILNTTLEAARMQLRKPGYYNSLCFSTYDRPVTDGIDGSCPFKPDAVGCNREISLDEKVSWRDILIAVEVENNWATMVAQAWTYSRCMFTSSQGRIHDLVIGFHHIRCEVRFLFFNRSGVTAYAAELTGEDGWWRFVAAIVGLASVPDRDSAGMDSSRDNSHFDLPVAGLCPVVKHICARSCVRGRATYVAQLNKGLSPKNTPELQVQPPNLKFPNDPQGRVYSSDSKA